MSDLERIRQLALKESARQASEQEKKEESLASEIRKMVKVHLPEWIRVIEDAIAAGKLGIGFEYRTEIGNNYGWDGWEKSSLLAPRISISLPDTRSMYGPLSPLSGLIKMYGEQLQEALGPPFHVSVDLLCERDCPAPWQNMITISWYQY